EDDWKVPLKAILQISRAMSHRIFRPRRDVAQLSRVMVIARYQSTVRACEDNLRIFRIRRNPAGFASAHIEPILTTDASVIRSARNPNGRVVLLRAVDVIREIVI